MDIQTAINALTYEWDSKNGFLGRIREGDFQENHLERFIEVLKSIELPADGCLDKRFVTLIWYIPVFLMWQKEITVMDGKDPVPLEKAINRVMEILEKLLGIP